MTQPKEERRLIFVLEHNASITITDPNEIIRAMTWFNEKGSPDTLQVLTEMNREIIRDGRRLFITRNEIVVKSKVIKMIYEKTEYK